MRGRGTALRRAGQSSLCETPSTAFIAKLGCDTADSDPSSYYHNSALVDYGQLWEIGNRQGRTVHEHQGAVNTRAANMIEPQTRSCQHGM